MNQESIKSRWSTDGGGKRSIDGKKLSIRVLLLLTVCSALYALLAKAAALDLPATQSFVIHVGAVAMLSQIGVALALMGWRSICSLLIGGIGMNAIFASGTLLAAHYVDWVDVMWLITFWGLGGGVLGVGCFAVIKRRWMLATITIAVGIAALTPMLVLDWK